ncbi:metallophosphoesterase family protein [Sphingomonas sp.]|uniref:metallophosphoesterase family protein n=1 Tax=Sphingomonas sp. TaxID=28214 RepID=UPI003D6D5230
MGIFGKFGRKQPKAPRIPSGPPDARAYAIGDVHGRLDLLRALIDEIAADRRANPCQREYIIFLGDLIDRGPDSRGVLDFLLQARNFLPMPVFVMGNHEEMLLRVLERDTDQFRDWLRYGGYECAQSYGVEVGRLALLDSAAAASFVRRAIPDDHLAFIDSFVDSFQFGDYLFVHAGIRPGVPIREQTIQDLRWIREDFLDSTVDHELIVVHGHTISDGPDEQLNRIGIDTGAYTSGILTALCIEGTGRRYLTARF